MEWIGWMDRWDGYDVIEKTMGWIGWINDFD